jgi:hypothetical protein
MVEDTIGKVQAVGDIVRMRFERSDSIKGTHRVSLWVRAHRKLVVCVGEGSSTEEALQAAGEAVLKALGNL